MTTDDFIIDLFCRIDDEMKDVPDHTQASLSGVSFWETW